MLRSVPARAAVLAACAAASVAVACEPGAEAPPSTPTRLGAEPALDGEELELLRLLNEYRASIGSPELAPSAEISAAADAHSEDMGTRGYFAHEAAEPAPNGVSPWERMCTFGFGPACDLTTALGENIAAGYQDARSAFLAWQGSEGHDANMRDPAFLAIGIGRVLVETSLYGWYWTTDFAGSAPECPCVDGQLRTCETSDCGRGVAECSACAFGSCAVPDRGDREVCGDGFDNDCDGTADEEDECGPRCEPEAETCDGLDNDCDGTADEDSICDLACLPLDEVCDGIDNDCDLTVDEGCPCDRRPENPYCGIEQGLCTSGSQECRFGEEGGVLTECRGAVAPSAEICDGLDNDCDGMVDEVRACGPAEGCGCRSAGCVPSGRGLVWALLGLRVAHP